MNIQNFDTHPLETFIFSDDLSHVKNTEKLSGLTFPLTFRLFYRNLKNVENSNLRLQNLSLQEELTTLRKQLTSEKFER